MCDYKHALSQPPLFGSDHTTEIESKICKRSRGHINIIRYIVSTLYILNVLDCVCGATIQYAEMAMTRVMRFTVKM